jgi:predicted lipid-binding transport protein (Tim44 family)
MPSRTGVARVAPLPLLLALAVPSAGQEPTSQQLGLFVYPAKGQTPARQQAEESECYGWARQQTGIDPTAPAPPPPTPTKQGMDGSMAKGAAGGALVGTAVGAIAGGTGEGAAIGAIAGGLRGRRKAKAEHKQQEQQAQQQAQAQQAHVRETFNKAYGACLEGKGYTVK